MSAEEPPQPRDGAPLWRTILLLVLMVAVVGIIFAVVDFLLSL